MAIVLQRARHTSRATYLDLYKPVHMQVNNKSQHYVPKYPMMLLSRSKLGEVGVTECQ
jgi:hypothetical protein